MDIEDTRTIGRRLWLPASTNGDADSAEDAVRLALMAVDRQQPGGQVLPVEALRTRVGALVAAQGRCDQPSEVGAGLPTLIRDLYSSIEAGRDVAELLDLAILLHTQVTVAWLRVLGASSDLRWQATTLAHNAAVEREEPTALGVALWGGLYVMIGAGTFDLALAELDSVTVPTTTPESMQVAGTLALCRSLLAAVDSRPGDVEAPFQQARELAERTGEGKAFGMSFGPTNVGLWQMYGQLDVKDYEQAVRVGEGLYPAHLPHLVQADYWVNFGRALARVQGRRDEAIAAFRRRGDLPPPAVPRRVRHRRDRRVARALSPGCGRPGVAWHGLPGWPAPIARLKGAFQPCKIQRCRRATVVTVIDLPQTPRQFRAPRRVIHATCSTHGGCTGFTNLVVTKRGDAIELDPHATGRCPLHTSIARSRSWTLGRAWRT